jgi:hypothetical protein
MSRQGIVMLPPSRLDVAISKRCARAATPARERSLHIMTWLADEKILLGVVALFWLNARLRPHDEEFRREADRMLLGIALAGAVPHVFKRGPTAGTARFDGLRSRPACGIQRLFTTHMRFAREDGDAGRPANDQTGACLR